MGAFTVIGGPVRADTASDLKAAQTKLDTLIASISSVTMQEGVLQGELDALAAQINDNQGAIEKTQADIAATQRSIQKLSADIKGRQGLLDERAVVAYETGPASNLIFFLGASSLNDLQDRIEIVSAAAASDRQLIDDMTQRKNQLHVKQTHLQDLQAQLQSKETSLESQQTALNAKFAEQATLLATLAAEKTAADKLVKDLTSKRQHEIYLQKLAEAQQQQQQQGGGTGTGGGSGTYVAFDVCPVDQPRTYVDSFGAPRYAGGYHPHAGNDIMAPLDTPIRAPFSGNAVASPNSLGGLAVTIYGSTGYVYNAHLNKYGALGSVSAGTIVGYVGNTGDAQGGPTHDHFEWHPNSIPANPWKSPYGYTVINGAVDPYPYLNSAC